VGGIDPLAASPYFEGLPAEQIDALRGAGRVVRLGAGEVLLRPGEHNHALHFVLSGTLEVRLEESSALISRVGPGECLGEMSVVDGQPASAWVVADGRSEILSIPEETLWSDLLSRPAFARGLLRLLSGRLRQVLERQASYEMVRKELRLAREIQASMLPRAGALFPDRPELECAAAMDPAAEVGGDFFDAFFLDERHLFFAVGDVAGKGIGAALFMVRALTLLRAEALRRRPFHELLGRVNEALVVGNEQATFVALTCGILDARSGALRYANGGGGAPLVRRAGCWSRLPMPRGLVVGAIPGFAFETARERLAAGETLVLFSDGVTEARSPSGELFGQARLLGTLEAQGDVTAVDRVAGIREAVLAFESGQRPADDLTLLVVGRPPRPTPTAT
jgi:sigma-B regulation protein RsbU (phosphoserine phosphatase)